MWFIVHQTYIVFSDEIFNKFSSGIIIFTAPKYIVTIKVS